MNKLLVITGPTAVGKTQLAFKLAKEFNGELISADSRQVYKGMDIGTGKEFSAEIPTWGYDVVKPNEEWSTAHFVRLANKLILEIQNKGKLPIVVGGTGLYISNLLNPPETLNIPPDKKLRNGLETLTVEELQRKLRELNFNRFERMNESDRENPRRLIRAIEVEVAKRKKHYHRFARSLDKLVLSLSTPLEINSVEGLEMTKISIFKIGLKISTEEMDQRIEARVKQRLNQGALKEVKNLVKKYGWNSALSFTIGYKEWKPYFVPQSGIPLRGNGKATLEDVINLWTLHEKQYARRQIVWLKTHPPDVWLDISKKTSGEDIVSSVKQWYYE